MVPFLPRHPQPASSARAAGGIPASPAPPPAPREPPAPRVRRSDAARQLRASAAVMPRDEGRAGETLGKPHLRAPINPAHHQARRLPNPPAPREIRHSYAARGRQRDSRQADPLAREGEEGRPLGGKRRESRYLRAPANPAAHQPRPRARPPPSSPHSILGDRIHRAPFRACY
jgi:hypothetical protein